MGYEIHTGQEKNKSQHYVLQQNKYEIRRKKTLQTLLPEFYPNKIKITFNLDDEVDLFYHQKTAIKPLTIDLEILVMKK